MPEEYKTYWEHRKIIFLNTVIKRSPSPVVCNPFIRIRTKKATHFHKNLSKK